MIENSLEKNINKRVVELGEIHEGFSKYESIKLMDEIRLPIPDTCILGIGFNRKSEQLDSWLENHEDNDIIIRTSNKKQSRGSKSIRDPQKEEININNLKDFVDIDQLVILQALPKGSINHDCLSGICKIDSDDNYYGSKWEIHCHPDIASLTNRLGLSNWWEITLRNYEIVKIEKASGNRETLLDAIYYRVGRTLLKEKNIELSRLEKVEYKGKDWNKGVKYCKKNLEKLSDDHSLRLLNKRIEKEGLNNLLPVSEDIHLLLKQFRRFKKIFNTLAQENGITFSFGVKFSILEYQNKPKQLLCWDIIKGA